MSITNISNSFISPGTHQSHWLSGVPLIGRIFTVTSAPLSESARLAQKQNNSLRVNAWASSQKDPELARLVLANVPIDVFEGSRAVSRSDLRAFQHTYNLRLKIEGTGEEVIRKYSPAVVNLAIEGMEDDLELMKLGLKGFSKEARLKLLCGRALAFQNHLHELKKTYPASLVEKMATTHFKACMMGVEVFDKTMEADLKQLLDRAQLNQRFADVWKKNGFDLDSVQTNSAPLPPATLQAAAQHIAHQNDYSKLIRLRESKALFQARLRDVHQEQGFLNVLMKESIDLKLLRKQLPKGSYYRKLLDQFFKKKSEGYPLDQQFSRRVEQLAQTSQELQVRIGQLDHEVGLAKAAVATSAEQIEKSLAELDQNSVTAVLAPEQKVFSIIDGDLVKRVGARVLVIHLSKMKEEERQEIFPLLTKSKVLELLNAHLPEGKNSVCFNFDETSKTFVPHKDGKIKIWCDHASGGKGFIGSIEDLPLNHRSRVRANTSGDIVRANAGEVSQERCCIFAFFIAIWKMITNLCQRVQNKASLRTDKHDLQNLLRNLFHSLLTGKINQLNTNDFLHTMEYIDRVIAKDRDLADRFFHNPEVVQYLDLYKRIKEPLAEALRSSDTQKQLAGVLGVRGDMSVDRKAIDWKHEKTVLLRMRNFHSTFKQWEMAIEALLRLEDDPYVNANYGFWLANMKTALPRIKKILQAFPPEFQGAQAPRDGDAALIANPSKIEENICLVIQKVEKEFPALERLAEPMSLYQEDSLRLKELEAGYCRKTGQCDQARLLLSDASIKFATNVDRVRLTLEEFLDQVRPEGKLLMLSLDAWVNAKNRVYKFQKDKADFKSAVFYQKDRSKIRNLLFCPVTAKATAVSPDHLSAAS